MEIERSARYLELGGRIVMKQILVNGVAYLVEIMWI